jgi:hypothetical protein
VCFVLQSVATERKYSLFYPEQDKDSKGPRHKKRIDYVAMLTPTPNTS